MQSDDKKKQLFFEEIRSVSTSGIGIVKFVSGAEGFVARTATMKKLGILLVERYGKAEFSPKELQKSYNFIITYILPSLEFEEQILIEGAFKRFVEKGGDIQVIKRASKETFSDMTPFPFKILKKFFYLIAGSISLGFIWYTIFLNFGVRWVTDNIYVDYKNNSLIELLERTSSPVEITLSIINPFPSLLAKNAQKNIILSDIDTDTFEFVGGDQNINGIGFYKDQKNIYYVFKDTTIEGDALSGEKILGVSPHNMSLLNQTTIYNGFETYKCDIIPPKQGEVCYQAQ